MQAQTLIVWLVVVACALQATWLLMPAALRRRLAARVLHRELPAATGCASGCDGCGSATKAASVPLPGSAQPLRFHPRAPR